MELSELKLLNSSQIDNLKVEAEEELKKNLNHQTIIEMEVASLKFEQAKIHLRQKELEQSLLKAKSVTSQLRLYISQLKSLFFSSRNTEN